MEKGYFLYHSNDVEKDYLLMDIEKIYNKMSDDMSRDIYINRLLYSLTLDMKFIRNIVLDTREGWEFWKQIYSYSQDKPILIYGAGKCGRQLVEIFSDIEWKGFIDENKIGSFKGIQIKKLKEYDCLSSYKIVVSNQVGHKEIRERLESKGVKREDIICIEELNKKLAELQYFEERCINLKDVKCFVDAGAYDGKDSIRFIKSIKEAEYKVWAFEPDIYQYIICKKELEKYPNINILNLGLGEKISKSNITMLNNSGSYLGSGDGVEILITTIDEIILDEKIDYIKMDIEGYEEKALIGAMETIKNYKPKLAVCVYHKRNDIFRIPKMLLDINPEYKFKMGHYSIRGVDTVLYAY